MGLAASRTSGDAHPLTARRGGYAASHAVAVGSLRSSRVENGPRIDPGRLAA